MYSFQFQFFLIFIILKKSVEIDAVIVIVIRWQFGCFNNFPRLTSVRACPAPDSISIFLKHFPMSLKGQFGFCFHDFPEQTSAQATQCLSLIAVKSFASRTALASATSRSANFAFKLKFGSLRCGLWGGSEEKIIFSHRKYGFPSECGRRDMDRITYMNALSPSVVSDYSGHH